MASGQFAQVDQQANAGASNFAMGTYVLAYSSGAYGSMTQSLNVWIANTGANYYVLNTQQGTLLAGTYKHRGAFQYSSGNYMTLMQRTT